MLYVPCTIYCCSVIQLFCVAQGTATAGHYFSFAKHNGSWYKLNDERVTAVTIDELETECFGNGVSNTNAYMLVYRLEPEPEPEPEDPDLASEEEQQLGVGDELTHTHSNNGMDDDAAFEAAMAASLVEPAPEANVDDEKQQEQEEAAAGEILVRTKTLSQDIDNENQALLRQAELFDNAVMNMLRDTVQIAAEQPSINRRLLLEIILDVLSRVVCRWKNCSNDVSLGWLDLLAAVPMLWIPDTPGIDDDNEVSSSDSEDEVAAAVRSQLVM